MPSSLNALKAHLWLGQPLCQNLGGEKREEREGGEKLPGLKRILFVVCVCERVLVVVHGGTGFVHVIGLCQQD